MAGTLQAFACAAATALALLPGCLDVEEAPLSDTSFSLTLTDVPASVPANGTFTVHLTALSLANIESSSHVGAHYWSEPTFQPDADFALATACRHLSGSVQMPGGPWSVSCTAPATPGAIELRGHARLTGPDGQVFNYWSMPDSVQVVAAAT